MFAFPPLRRNLPAALRDLGSKRAEVRRSALADLVSHVDSSHRSDIVSAVRHALLADSDPEVRSTAAIVIADAGLSELAGELATVVGDDDPRVQQMALLAIAEVAAIGERAISERLRPLLASPLPALRYQALVAWTRLHEPDFAVEELLSAIKDPDEEVRWIAWTFIEELVERAEQSGEEADRAKAFRGLSSERTVELRQAIMSGAPDAAVRNQIVAATVRYRMGDAAAMARLFDNIEQGGRLPSAVVIELIQRLGRLRYEPARAWLSRRARRGWFEGPFGWAATVALGALGDPRGQTAILAELDAISAWRRERALRAVGELKLTAATTKVESMARRPSGVEPWLAKDTLIALGDRDRRQ